MQIEPGPIDEHECVELAEIASYYVRRNVDALRLLDHAASLPGIVDADGEPLFRYETMVIRSIELVSGHSRRRARLYPALPINGSRQEPGIHPIEITMSWGSEPRSGYIALIQRHNGLDEIGAVLFFDDVFPFSDRKPDNGP